MVIYKERRDASSHAIGLGQRGNHNNDDNGINGIVVGRGHHHHTQQQQHHHHQQNDDVVDHFESLEFASEVESEATTTQLEDFNGRESVITAQTAGTYMVLSSSSSHTADATDTVHEMHLALLYLLSNPEEFHRALASRPPLGATTLADWNAEYDIETDVGGGADSLIMTESHLAGSGGTPGVPLVNHCGSTPNASVSANSHHANNMNGGSLHQQQQQQQTVSSPPGGHGGSAGSSSTPLPFVVFADDAEVVLPQAHTASQLFGVERIEGVELEAAAGIPGLSQLFLRWLALMPGGDHLNIIDPPGLTVMRIAGGRYRVTAAHRVVWTWMNEFAPLMSISSPEPSSWDGAASTSSPTPSSSFVNGGGGGGTNRSFHNNNNVSSNSSYGGGGGGGGSGIHNNSNNNNNNSKYESVNSLQIGDLVTMTIVDVFETDSQGKLLSYCPTFDNRAVHKTHPTTETFRKRSTQLLHILHQARKSKTAEIIVKNAKSVALTIGQKVGEAVTNYNNNNNNTGGMTRRRSDSVDGGGDHHDDDVGSLKRAIANHSSGPFHSTDSRSFDDNNTTGCDRSVRTAESSLVGLRVSSGDDGEQQQQQQQHAEEYEDDDDAAALAAGRAEMERHHV